jgi:hypothetical protein
MKKPTTLLILLIVSTLIYSQTPWVRNIQDDNSMQLNHFSEHYDKGIVLAGNYGNANQEHFFFCKLDINGNQLWNKTYGTEGIREFVTDFSYDSYGNVYFAGNTSVIDPITDPRITKVNACGEVEWCWIYNTNNHVDYAHLVESLDDGGCVAVLTYTDFDITQKRICLVRLDENGNVVWLNHFQSSDPRLFSEDSQSLILTPDNGYLVSGETYYRDTTPPYYGWLHSYFMKINEFGILEWEKVILKDIQDEGGVTNHTVLSPDSSSYYSASVHSYHYDGYTPALQKLDLNGELLMLNDLVESTVYHHGFFRIHFVNNDKIAGSAEYFDQPSPGIQAITMDTLGQIQNSRTIRPEAEYGAWMDVTHDGKLLYATVEWDNQNILDTYLHKYNQDLEYDSIYTQQFDYDYLCDHPITSDTIAIGDCGIWLDADPILENKQGELKAFPNPCFGNFTLELPDYILSTNNRELFDMTHADFQYQKHALIRIHNLNGQCIQEVKLNPGEKSINVSLPDQPAGMYMVSLIVDGNKIGNVKIVVQD